MTRTIVCFSLMFALLACGSVTDNELEQGCAGAANDWPRVIVGILGEEGAEVGEKYTVYAISDVDTEHRPGILHGCPLTSPFLVCSYSWTPGANVDSLEIVIEGGSASSLVEEVVPVPGVAANTLVYLEVSFSDATPTVKDAAEVSVCGLEVGR